MLAGNLRVNFLMAMTSAAPAMIEVTVVKVNSTTRVFLSDRIRAIQLFINRRGAVLEEQA